MQVDTIGNMITSQHVLELVNLHENDATVEFEDVILLLQFERQKYILFLKH